MGTVIGALLSKQGYQIDLLDTRQSHIDALNQNGATIVGNLGITTPVRAITPAELTGQYDIVISTVKQNALRDSLIQLLPVLHEESLLLTLQNGIPEDIASDIVGSHRVLGGAMKFSGTFVDAGVVKLASPLDTLGITIGEINGEITERLKLVQSILQHIGHCSLTNKLREARYTKLIDNCVASAIPTALGCLLGKALDDNLAVACMAQLGHECATVLSALNIETQSLFGFEPTLDNLAFSDTNSRDKAIDYWRTTYLPYREQTASMLQDLKLSRPCEVDYINGKMLREAKKVGVGMPMNRAVITAIKAIASRHIQLEQAWRQLDGLTKQLRFN